MGKTRGNSRTGGAAIEFALVLPVLMLLLLGIIEYGWVFFQQSNILSAAREGARYGVTFSQTGSPTPVSAATTRVAAALTTNGVTATPTITVAQSGATPAEVLNVTVVVPYTPLVGLVPTPDQLTGQTTMLLEVQD